MDEWSRSGNMVEGRYNIGYGSSESWGLVMVGGYRTSNGSIISVETTSDGETFGSLPNLPHENYESCVVIIDDDRLFTCGGVETESQTLIFSKSNNSWNRYNIIKESFLFQIIQGDQSACSKPLVDIKTEVPF